MAHPQAPKRGSPTMGIPPQSPQGGPMGPPGAQRMGSQMPPEALHKPEQQDQVC